MTTEIIVIISLAVCCMLWYIVASILIYENLRRRGEKVSFLWLRAMAPIYASRYRKLTKQETGRTGMLFYHWVVSVNLALVLTLLAVAVHLV